MQAVMTGVRDRPFMLLALPMKFTFILQQKTKSNPRTVERNRAMWGTNAKTNQKFICHHNKREMRTTTSFKKRIAASYISWNYKLQNFSQRKK
jgi:hypothetical protein